MSAKRLKADLSGVGAPRPLLTQNRHSRHECIADGKQNLACPFERGEKRAASVVQTGPKVVLSEPTHTGEADAQNYCQEKTYGSS